MEISLNTSSLAAMIIRFLPWILLISMWRLMWKYFLHSWSEATLALVWCNSDRLQNSSLSYFVEIFLNLCLAGILVCSFPFCLFWFYITVLFPQHGHAGLVEWCRRVACLWILWILGVLQETSVPVFFFLPGLVKSSCEYSCSWTFLCWRHFTTDLTSAFALV